MSMFHSFLAFWLPRADREKTLLHRLDAAREDQLHARIACACAEAVVEELEVELHTVQAERMAGSLSKALRAEDLRIPVPEVRHADPFKGVDTGRFDRG